MASLIFSMVSSSLSQPFVSFPLYFPQLNQDLRFLCLFNAIISSHSFPTYLVRLQIKISKNSHRNFPSLSFLPLLLLLQLFPRSLALNFPLFSLSLSLGSSFLSVNFNFVTVRAHFMRRPDPWPASQPSPSFSSSLLFAHTSPSVTPLTQRGREGVVFVHISMCPILEPRIISYQND